MAAEFWVAADLVDGVPAGSVAAAKVVAVSGPVVDVDPSAGLVATEVDEESWPGLAVVAATVVASAGVVAAVAGVDDVSLGLVVSAATVAGAGVVSPAGGVDESAAGVVADVVVNDSDDDEDEADESLAAVLAAELSVLVVDAEGVPAAL